MAEALKTWIAVGKTLGTETSAAIESKLSAQGQAALVVLCAIHSLAHRRTRIAMTPVRLLLVATKLGTTGVERGLCPRYIAVGAQLRIHAKTIL
jgi:hypothetical protein